LKGLFEIVVVRPRIEGGRDRRFQINRETLLGNFKTLYMNDNFEYIVAELVVQKWSRKTGGWSRIFGFGPGFLALVQNFWLWSRICFHTRYIHPCNYSPVSREAI